MYPDIALECYDKGIFIPNIYMEFKSTKMKGPFVAVQQLMDSLRREYGQKRPSRGFFCSVVRQRA